MSSLAATFRESTKHFRRLPAEDVWTVTTTKGQVKGAALKNGGGCFLGIPFARPPVGELRWRAPVEADSWEGVLECTHFGPVCPQIQVPGTGVKLIPVPPDLLSSLTPENALPLGMDEDCLQVNVYTPSLEGKYPVLVWIHGGNLTGGCSSDNLVFEPLAHFGSNPAIIAEKHNLVVVTVGYRLNIFGFLNLISPDVTGNCGLLDCSLALKWVQREVASFGGDADNVTICGLSAGGHLVSQLLSLEEAKGTFKRAICMSGSAQWTIGSPKEHKRRVLIPLSKRLGFESPEDMTPEALRQLPAEALRQCYLKSRDFLESGTMSVDSVTVPGDPLEAMKNGCAAEIPILTGVTRDEGVFSTKIKRKGSTFEDTIQDVKRHLRVACYLMEGDLDVLRDIPEDVCEEIAKGLVADYQDLVRRYKAATDEVADQCVNLSLTKCEEIADEAYELSAKILGDHDFLLAHLMAAWTLGHHSDVRSYIFSNECVKGKRFVSHGDDQVFLFGAPSPRGDAPGAEEARNLSESIMEAWANFVKTGDPSTPSIGEWPVTKFPGRGDMKEKEIGVLPESPQDRMLHMNFEHGRTKLVSNGFEEFGIWYKHMLILERRLQAIGWEIKVRSTFREMGESILGQTSRY